MSILNLEIAAYCIHRSSWDEYNEYVSYGSYNIVSISKCVIQVILIYSELIHSFADTIFFLKNELIHKTNKSIFNFEIMLISAGQTILWPSMLFNPTWFNTNHDVNSIILFTGRKSLDSLRPYVVMEDTDDDDDEYGGRVCVYSDG